MIVTAEEDTARQFGRTYSHDDHFAALQKHLGSLSHRRGDLTPPSLSLSDRSNSDSNGSDHRTSPTAHGTIEGRYRAAVEKLAQKEILLRSLQCELSKKEEQLSSKEEELMRKDAQVASLEEKLVQMSLELATTKAFQDEFHYLASRNQSASSSNAPTQRKPPSSLIQLQEVETKFSVTAPSRMNARSSRLTNEHSKSDGAIPKPGRLTGAIRHQTSCELPSFLEDVGMPRIDTGLAVAAPARRMPSKTRHERHAPLQSQSDSAIPKSISFCSDKLDETSVISEYMAHEILHDMVRKANASREESKTKLTHSQEARTIRARTISQDVNKLPPPIITRESSLDLNKLASSVRSFGEFLHSSFAKSDASAKKPVQDATGGGPLRFSAAQHEADKCTEAKDEKYHPVLTDDHLHLDGVVFHDQLESSDDGNENQEWPEL